MFKLHISVEQLTLLHDFKCVIEVIIVSEDAGVVDDQSC